MSSNLSTGAGSALVTRMLAASTCLTGQSKDVFDRVFLAGESEDGVRIDLNLSEQQYQERKTNMLRSLMAASS